MLGMRELGRAAAFGAITVGCALVVATAYAQAPELRLRVEGDARGCVSEAALRARLGRYLRVHRPIQVEVVVRAGAEPVAFELQRAGAQDAVRTFEVLPRTCPERLDALAV